MFAPNINQMHVINHLEGNPSEEKRNVLVESARLARGNIQELSILSVKDHDAVIFPGFDTNLLSYTDGLVVPRLNVADAVAQDETEPTLFSDLNINHHLNFGVLSFSK